MAWLDSNNHFNRLFGRGHMKRIRLYRFILYIVLSAFSAPSLLAAESVGLWNLFDNTTAAPPTRKPMARKVPVETPLFLGQSVDSLPPLRLGGDFDGLSCDLSQRQYRGQGAWAWRLFPDGLIFPSFLAGVNESRMGGVWNNDKDLGWVWDITLGGRAPLLRYGNKSTLNPEGWQLDIEGSVHLRLDLENEMDMDANDFRFGVPISYGTKTWQIRFGYYHVSSHMGDERMLRLESLGQPHKRINYHREALIFGYAYKPRQDVRLYFEADFAADRGECTKKWHFQFGAEYSPKYPADGFRGTPFAAINVMLLEERHFDGNITAQLGWQWRGSRNQIFRVGVQYFGGVSEQYEHIMGRREHKVGLGFWYDF